MRSWVCGASLAIVGANVAAAPRNKPATTSPAALSSTSKSAKPPSSAQTKPVPTPKAPEKAKAKLPKGRPPPPAPCSPRWRPRVPQGYRAAVELWHRPVTTHVHTNSDGLPYLTLEILNSGEKIEVPPQSETGRFSAADLDRLAHALRDTRRTNEYPIDPLLADLVYDIQRHFGTNALRVVSGYRTPSGQGHSNHGRGRAMDLIVPGTKDEDVAAYVRTRGFVGVGVYPSSGFVHVDVRPQSYYWIDASGPGEKNCEKGTRGAEARTNDLVALAAGRRAPAGWSEPASNVDTLWRERRSAQDLRADPHDEPVEEDDLDTDHD